MLGRVIGRSLHSYRVPDIDYAYEMGSDCERNGPNSETNCHFSLFETPELIAAWERGKKEARVDPYDVPMHHGGIGNDDWTW